MESSHATRAVIIAQLCEAIPMASAVGHPVRVAIDGIDGAGKTRLRAELADELRARDRNVIEASIDDFHHVRAVRHQHGHHDWKGYWNHAFNLERLVGDLLEPLGPNGGRKYRVRCHDLATDAVLDDEPWHEAPDDAVLLVDSVLAQRKELREHWDHVVFVQVRFADAYRRLAQRDGVPADPSHPDNARYYGAQQYYLGTFHPERTADAVVDNNDWANPRIVRAG